MTSKITLKALVLIFFSMTCLLAAAPAGATDVAKTPLIPASVAKPNVIIGMDDSGSMDFEVMLTTNDGALWWNDSTVFAKVTGTGWDTNGVPLFNSSGNSGGGWTKLTYLFPNGCSSAERLLCDSSGHYAIAPTYQFAWLRSSAYNPLYYNSAVTYQPWVSAYVSGATKTFGNATGTAALSHPLFTTTDNLTAEVTLSTASNTVFEMRPGMWVPAGSKIDKSGSWQVLGSGAIVDKAEHYRAAITFYPATYWAPASCTADNVTCTKAPDGTTLKRYEIKVGNTFPSGRTYAAEMQNFANWYSFFRKRKLMLAASAGLVLDSLTGMRVGLVEFNSPSAVTMADTDLTDASKNAKTIIGKFYGNASNGGTPARETLKYIGNQFATRAGAASASDTSTSNIVTFSCQKNAAFVMTDGFAYANTVTPPAYLNSTYGAATPYATTYAGTLADIALSYYTKAITGTSLTGGNVPAAAPTPTNPQNDGNANLHVNTYAMTLGAHGTLWPGVSNAYTAGIVWPNPNVDRSPTAVDDLWHATVNGRGQMFTASTPLETAQSISAGLSNILTSAGSQAAVAFSTVNIRPDEALGFVGSYTPVGWSGDISAYPVNTTTGDMARGTALWSADALLQARGYSTRAIATFSGVQGTELGTPANWSALYAAGKIQGTVVDFVAYLRGQRTNEGTTYRNRTGLIGAVVNAEPVSWLADKMVYATSNAGFLHALDKTTGAELWAYAPKFALPDVAALSVIGSTFNTVLDGTPVVARISASRTVLVGGRGSAGTGFYALDISNPRGAFNGTGVTAQTDALVAQRALWEFPSTSTPVTVTNALGTSTGKPLLVNTSRWGWVALVTSGYNSTLDGKGRLFVLNAITGALLDTIVTPAGTAGAGEAGLSSVSGFLEADNTVQFVYGGDLLGNLWKINLTTSTVTRLATLTNASNATLPVTAAPELATFNSRRMVYVGTGRLLGPSDFSDTSTNSFFALWDDGTEINKDYAQGTATTNLRKFLAPRAITVDSNGNRTATGAVLLVGETRSTCTGATKVWTSGACYSNPAIDWTTQRGWYVEMPAGEKANTDPTVGLGLISWTTNSPSLTSCSSSSALYFADAETGLQLPASMFADKTPLYGVPFSTTLSSRPVIARLPSGWVSLTVHRSDNTTSSVGLDLGGGSSVSSLLKKGKIAWRQVLR